MRSYLNLLGNILVNGQLKNPTRVVDGEVSSLQNNTVGLPCQSVTHDMADGFPLLTTKRMHLKSILVELEAFLGGITDKQWLKDRDCNIWNEWHKPHSKNHDDLGTYYAWQMRRFGHHYAHPIKDKLEVLENDPRDQIASIVNALQDHPSDRRMVCSMWNPMQLDTAALPSCHFAFNVIVYGDDISLQVTIRSNDMVLGWPYNIAYYATLLLLFARVGNFTPRLLKIDSNDAHIYLNQIEGVREQLKRIPKALPSLEIVKPYEGPFDLFKWTHKDVKLTGYNSYPKIKFEVTV